MGSYFWQMIGKKKLLLLLVVFGMYGVQWLGFVKEMDVYMVVLWMMIDMFVQVGNVLLLYIIVYLGDFWCGVIFVYWVGLIVVNVLLSDYVFMVEKLCVL